MQGVGELALVLVPVYIFVFCVDSCISTGAGTCSTPVLVLVPVLVQVQV